jgi:FKBP-type peptidyl-prolyl cis-trans isomerase
MKQKTLVADQAAQEIFTEADLSGVQYEDKYPSGLKMHIVYKGDGPMPKKGQQVSVHYRGYLLSGKIFDESYRRGQPITFPVGTGRVIRGWDEAIMKLNTGSRALIYLPAEIAYGDRGAGADIPPGATLVFDVVLMEVK